MSGQLDLARIAVNPAYVVYRNEAALPARALLAPGAGSGTAFDVDSSDLTGASPLLEDQAGRTTFEGTVDAGVTVLHSAAAASGWELLIEGRAAPETKLFGWADGYQTESSGTAVLRYDTSISRYGVVGIQAVLWAVAIIAVFRMRRRGRIGSSLPAPAAEKVDL
jgi:hypothetical protein